MLDLLNKFVAQLHSSATPRASMMFVISLHMWTRLRLDIDFRLFHVFICYRLIILDS